MDARGESGKRSGNKYVAGRAVRGRVYLGLGDVWGDAFSVMATRQNLTDRAYRYRANQNAPKTRRQCAFCGTKKNVEVGHVDGHEENDSPENMIWTCRSCNVVAGNTMRAYGLGRLTNQYNPGRRLNPASGGGAKSLGQWMQAVGAITPHQDRGDRGLSSDMDVKAAVQMIRDTPQSRRAKFAAELNKHKRGRASARWNPTRENIWPFSDSRLSARQTTAATGGIAKFSKGVKAKAKKAVASAKKSGDYESIPTAAAVEQAYASGAKTLKEALEMAGARVNPAKFDRCVRDVKKRGGSANAYAVCTAAGTRKKRKRNPADESIAAYEDFHGRPPSETVEVTRKVHYHGHLSAAGELKRLVVIADNGRLSVTLRNFGGAILAFNEARNQLFIEGGDQEVNVKDFGIRTPHEVQTLGQVKKIDYFTTKDHLGSEGGTATYQHTFRTTNENGRHVTIRIARYPDLIYRTLEKHLEFSGGSYTILPEGIDR